MLFFKLILDVAAKGFHLKIQKRVANMKSEVNKGPNKAAV